MAKQYSPTVVEKAWYGWWETSSFFIADANSSKEPFAIVLPPPNVTGALHIGHALTVAIQMGYNYPVRRISGYNTLWIPGIDHAGIATQVVVEKKIMRERRLTRHDLGREQFVSEPYLPLLKPKSCFRDLIGSLGKRKKVGITFFRKVLAH